MKLRDFLPERDEGILKTSYGDRRRQLLAKISEKIGLGNKDPNVIMTAAKEYLSLPPFSFWSEGMRRRMLADIMDAFGVMPPDVNQSVFLRQHY